MNILVSACLMGVCCRWDGDTNGPHPDLEALMKTHNLIPICPEIMGGLPTPRQPAERRGEVVATRDYRNVTEEYERGAEEALKLCHLYGCQCSDAPCSREIAHHDPRQAVHRQKRRQ